jgi:hypothetical protein
MYSFWHSSRIPQSLKIKAVLPFKRQESALLPEDLNPKHGTSSVLICNIPQQLKTAYIGALYFISFIYSFIDNSKIPYWYRTNRHRTHQYSKLHALQVMTQFVYMFSWYSMQMSLPEIMSQPVTFTVL